MPAIYSPIKLLLLSLIVFSSHAQAQYFNQAIECSGQGVSGSNYQFQFNVEVFNDGFAQIIGGKVIIVGQNSFLSDLARCQHLDEYTLKCENSGVGNGNLAVSLIVDLSSMTAKGQITYSVWNLGLFESKYSDTFPAGTLTCKELKDRVTQTPSCSQVL